MTEELTPEEKKILEELFEAVASAFAQGISKEDIIQELVEQDLPEEFAKQVVNRVEQAIDDYYYTTPEGRKLLAEAYVRHMGYGILWAIIGTVVTVGSYESAVSRGGGTYIVAWGAILFGVLEFLIGFFGWIKYVL